VSALLIALLILGAEAKHAPAARHPEVVLSEDYAPIVWLAEDEPLYPMLPYAFAFDDAENGTGPDQLIDVADPGEISGTFSNPAKDAFYKKRLRSRPPGGRAGSEMASSVAQTLPDMVAVVERSRVSLPPATVLYYGPAAQGTPVATTKARQADVASLRAGTIPEPVRALARKAGIAVTADPEASTAHERIGDPAREWYVGEDLAGHDAIVKLTDGFRFELYVGPSCRFEYWFYYLFDQGLNGHLHDSEHAFVFVEPLVRERQHDSCKVEPADHPTGAALTRPLVRAVVGAGHEEHTANNILVASPKRRAESAADVMGARHNLVFPQGLPFHMPILVELGKHASAPDRSFDGRFDFGMDANVFPESVWGTRDVQAGNVGRMKLGRFANWFSFPRSERGIVMPSGWLLRKEYSAAFPLQIQELRVREDVRTYRLVPVTDLRDLHDLLRAAGGAADPSAVEAFLQKHRDCLWATTENIPDPVTVTSDALEAMIETWTQVNPKRDVWSHNDHTKPDSIFKLAMFRRFSLGAAMRADSGAWGFGPALQIAQVTLPRSLPLVGGSMLFNDSTLNVQALFNRTPDEEENGRKRIEFQDLGVLVNSYRGRYFGWYVAGDWRPSIRDGCCRLGGGLAASVPSVPRLRAVSVTARIGLLGDPFRVLRWKDGMGARRTEPIAPVFSLEVTAGVGGVKHPLSF
jgi:hypothetical protein